VTGSYIGDRWRQNKGGPVATSSRRAFGSTAAAYRALRKLVELGLCEQTTTKSEGGYSIITFKIKD